MTSYSHPPDLIKFYNGYIYSGGFSLHFEINILYLKVSAALI